MATGVLMPKAGISVESCIITEWMKKPGDTVSVGDILFSYETDKAAFECESTAEGELLEIFYQNGDEVPVLVNVCAVGKAGEDVSALRPAGEQSEAPAAVPGEPAAQKEVQAPAAAQTTVPAGGGEVRISPRARNLAAAQNIDIRQAAPSGPYGRIIERDIRRMMAEGIGVMTGAAYAYGTGTLQGTGTAVGGRIGVADLAVGAPAAAPVSEGPEYEDIAFTGVRRAISKSMTASLRDIPQLTHNFSFDVSELMGYRAKLKDSAQELGLPNITYNDMILYAVSRLLPKYPDLNAHMLDGTTIRRFKDVHLGMAVDTEKGLLVPVIRQANRKSLAQIAAEAKALARQAQEGTLNPDDMTGGTFTVSNLGSLGVESFTPVINPPQAGILGVNCMQQRVRETNGAVEVYPVMGISLTYDHRAIDGAPASRFAAELCRSLERFTLLLAQ